MPTKNELYEAVLWLSGITHVSNGWLMCRKSENALSYGLVVYGFWLLLGVHGHQQVKVSLCTTSNMPR